MIIGKDAQGKEVSIDLVRLVESRMLVQANSGAGKSWAIRRILEQTFGKTQHLVIDVEDEFHTLREHFDYVLAGRHGGDCPADARSAPLLARRLLELRASAIIGIYELKHDARIQFVKLFLESLVNAPRDLWHPVLVVVDEAHIFCPEGARAESAAAVIDLMTRGRKRGFAGILATQRISKLNKDAAAEANNKLIGRSALDIDMKRAADELGFTGRDAQNSLRTLAPGEFFAFGPAVSDRVTLLKVGPVLTTHPKAGQRVLAPPPPRDKVRAMLAQLADLPAEVEAEVKTTAELRKRIAELERAAKASTAPVASTAVLREAREAGREEGQREGQARLKAALDTVVSHYDQWWTGVQGLMAETRKRILLIPPIPPPRAPAKLVSNDTRRAPAPPVRSPSPGTDGKPLPIGERAVLTVCAQYPDGAARDQITILTGYKRSSRDAYLQRLREKGLVDSSGVAIQATPAGFEALGPGFEPLPTGEALRGYWLDRLPEGERKMLEILLAYAGKAVNRDALVTGYQRSSRNAYLQRLKARRLVEFAGRGEVRASEVLFE